MIIGLLLFVVCAVLISLFGHKISTLLMKITIPGKSSVWDYLLYVLLFLGITIGVMFFWFQVVEPNKF